MLIPILWLPGTFHVSLPVSKFSTPGLNTHGKWSHCGNTQFDKCPGKWALLLLLKGKCYIYPTDNAAGFPTGVPSSRYECVMQINFLTRESVSHYKQPLRTLVEPDICKTYAHAICLLCWTMFHLCYVHYCLCIYYVTHQTT